MHTLVVNGCECEPYLTCDHRVMVEEADDLVTGIRYAMRATGAVRAIVGVEDNKPDAVVAIDEAIERAGRVPEGEIHPVIAEGRSEIDDVANRVGKVGDMASFALSNINQLLSTENRETAMATVRSLRDLATGLNERLAALDKSSGGKTAWRCFQPSRNATHCVWPTSANPSRK